MKNHRSLLLTAVLVAAGCAEVESGPNDGADAQAAMTTPLPDRPTVIAHRGYSAIAPEHTIPSFDAAAAAGADYLEQDLQMTSDGVLIVLHDATLDRTARGPQDLCTGPVIERTVAQVRECDVGTWFNEARPALARQEYAGVRIPTLDEVLARYGDSVRYYIETKNPEEAPGMEEALLDLLRRHDLRGGGESPPRVLIQSFSPESLQRIHSLDPDLPLVLLFGRMPSAEIQMTLDDVQSYAYGIGPHFSSVDEDLLSAAHARGLVVHPYTVNEEAEIRRLDELGIDGFFTDETERTLEILGR